MTRSLWVEDTNHANAVSVRRGAERVTTAASIDHGAIALGHSLFEDNANPVHGLAPVATDSHPSGSGPTPARSASLQARRAEGVIAGGDASPLCEEGRVNPRWRPNHSPLLSFSARVA